MMKDNIEQVLPTETFEVFSEGRRILGRVAFALVFRGFSESHLYRWARPVLDDLDNDARPNPLDRIRRYFADLVAADGRHVAEAGAQMVLEPLGMRGVYPETIIPDAPTVEAEYLDDYPAVQAFHEAVLAGNPRLVIDKLPDVAIRELKETAAKAKGGR